MRKSLLASASHALHDPLLSDITKELVARHGCHTIILYGSRASENFDAGSDYDIIAIREAGDFEKDCRLFKGFYLDAFIYPEGPINEPDSYLIRIRGGIVLLQKDAQGDALLGKVNSIFHDGPGKTPEWEKSEILAWLPKMLDRAKRADIEGNYRAHWLLTELLPTYFRLHELWYSGAKNAFPYLKHHDADVYHAFKSALELGADYEKLEKLVTLISRRYLDS